MDHRYEELIEWFRDNYEPGEQEGIKELLRHTQEAYGCVPAAVKESLIKDLGLAKGIVQILIRQLPGISEVSYEHKITVCNNTHCMARGADTVLAALQKKLGINKVGEVSADGRFWLTTQKCFKKCGVGPNVMIDDQLHTGVSAASVEELF
ncbi:MAG: NAD(P)H-dependent oxidoreductase subunit E [Eubacteriales bacterium]|nr:NAD(P)H-dependent oxidoreductase subunit E [Eubacteriales bacterium]